MLPKQRMLIAALIIQAFLFYTPTAAKLLKIFPKDSSFTDILGFEVESVNEKNATVLLSLKRTPLNISVSYSENLGYNNHTSPYDDWDPNKSDDYVGWVTHSNYIATENRLIIPYIVTGFYQFESNSVGEAVYYYIDTTVKDLESLQLSWDDFKGAFEHRKLLRVLLPTRVQQVTRRVINGKEKNPKECPEESDQEGFFIYSCDLSDEFLNNTNEVLVQLHDCRCNQQSIWYHNNLSCKAKYKYDDTVTKSKDPSKQIPVDNELTTIWIFGSVCLMLVVVVGILWLILFIHRRSSTTELPYTTKTVLCFDCVSIGSLSSGSTSLPTDVDMKKIEIKGNPLKTI